MLHPLTALQYQNHKTKSTLCYDFDSSCLRLGFPSFCATGTNCACKENKHIQAEVTARRLRQRGHHATLSALAGKLARQVLEVTLGKMRFCRALLIGAE